MVIPVPRVVFKPFEEKIIRLWIEGVVDLPWKWGVTAAVPKARFIKGYLLDKKQAYVKELWNAWSDFVDRAAQVDAHFKKGDYATLRTYLWLLRRLGLVRLVRRVPSMRKGYFERNIYALNMAKLDDPAWNRPLQSLYPSADWRIMPSDRKAAVRRRTKARKKARVLLTLRVVPTGVNCRVVS